MNEHTNYKEIEKYFKRVAEKISNIQISKEKMGGMPVIRNTRIPVSLIVACLKDQMTISGICEEYNLTEEDAEMAMDFVILIPPKTD